MDWQTIVLSAIAVVAVTWLADGARGVLLFDPWLGWWQSRIPGLTVEGYRWAGLGVVVLLAFTMSVWVHQRQSRRVRMLSRTPAGASQHEAIVFFVSVLRNEALLPMSANGSTTVGGVELHGLSIPEAVSALDNVSGGRWAWQQMLRGIAPHLSALRAVYLIGSTDEEDANGEMEPGSHHQLDAARNLLADLLGPDVEVLCADKAAHFEDITSLVEAAEEGLDRLEAMGIARDRILIDVTGGQKPTSIAGAVMTLNNDEITFQYVQTGGVRGAWTYDLQLMRGQP